MVVRLMGKATSQDLGSDIFFFSLESSHESLGETIFPTE